MKNESNSQHLNGHMLCEQLKLLNCFLCLLVSICGRSQVLEAATSHSVGRIVGFDPIWITVCISTWMLENRDNSSTRA